MQRDKSRKIIALLLVIIGVALIVKPYAQEYASANAQKELLKRYKESKEYESEREKEAKALVSSLDEAIPIIDEEAHKSKSELLRQRPDKPERIIEELDPISQKIEEEDIVPKGILKIEAINFEQVIMPTASAKDLSISVGWMPESSWMGDGGNICIAGHRSKTYGRNFNRLNSVEIEDVLTLEMKDESSQYKVVNKFIVEPEDVWVVSPFMDEETVTLITCTPIENPTNRLVIRAIKK
ncbi:class D sortase [Fusibacter sp. JL216-2]|uniref:class D sortase n=1 Tax=Fusibacter sp. JL216-2 TaxID=3071453 RepID=UPI003D3313C4